MKNNKNDVFVGYAFIHRKSGSQLGLWQCISACDDSIRPAFILASALTNHCIRLGAPIRRDASSQPGAFWIGLLCLFGLMPLLSLAPLCGKQPYFGRMLQTSLARHIIQT